MTWRAARLAALLVACAACVAGRGEPGEETTMVQSQGGVADPKSAYRGALAMAKSTSASDHATLRRNLGDRAWLAGLDSDEAYRGDPLGLRVAGVLQSFAGNAAPTARRALLELTRDPVFLEHRARTTMLIQALVVLRPAPPEAVDFWDLHCVPDDGYGNITIRTVIENGSAEALTVFEKNLRDPQQAEEDRDAWLLDDVIVHRNDLPLLEACERLLSGQLEDALRSRLVDVLFDYRPDDWYGPHRIPVPPPRAQASTEALRQLRRVGEKALTLPHLTPAQRKRVEEVLGEIRTLPNWK